MSNLKSILREKIAQKATVEAQLPISGIVRMGLRRITPKAMSNPTVLKLYEQALTGDITMKQAEVEALKLGVKNPFYPTNTQHFNIHPLEVEGGRATVEYLISNYGEDRGEGLKIYRFPVIFPDVPNGIDGVFKSKFEVHQGPTKYSSEYTDAGQRICVYRAPIDVSQQSKRKKFVAREKKVRGPCDPATCSEFAAGACRFTGTLHFYIPGVSGSGTWILKTGSTNAAEDVFLRLDDLYTRCKGRLPNFTPEGNPVFALTKKLKTMKYFDESGVERKADQWVLSLETVIDMSKLMLVEERKHLVITAPAPAPEGSSAPKSWLAQAPMAVEDVGVVGASPDNSTIGSSASSQVLADDSLTLDELLEQISELATESNIEEEVAEWAALKFGEDWFEAKDKAQSVFDDVNNMLTQLGHTQEGSDYVKEFLPMVCKMYENTLFPQQLGVPYIKLKFNLKIKDQRKAAAEHLNDLINLGSVEAKKQMQIYLEANTKK
jgi:Recombination directionality factor-like